MKLPTEFIRLPLMFDVARLTEEVQAFNASAWMPHVQRFEGNTSIPLISLNGEMNDAFNGPMRATRHLEQSPYIQQVLASIGEVYGRSRLMGLAAGCSVPEHRDVNYHWYNRVRIHIPIITNPAVLFYCGDKRVHMAAGETWIFDSWKPHHVDNGWTENRVHLVVDTAGSSRFWRLVQESEWRCSKQLTKPTTLSDARINYEPNKTVTLATEQFNAPIVMHPGEVDALTIDIVADMQANEDNDEDAAAEFALMLQDFRTEWRRLWSLHGESRAGWPHYRSLIKCIRLPPSKLRLASNHGFAAQTFSARVMSAALNESLAPQNRPD